MIHHNTKLVVGLAAVLLLGSSSIALAQSKSVTVSGGALVFALPAYASAPGVVIAGTVSVDGKVDVDPVGVFDGQIGYSFSTFFGGGNNTTTQTFTGPGVLTVPGYSTPTGTIDLATTSTGVNAAASSDITRNGQNQFAGDPNPPLTAVPGDADVYGILPGNGANPGAFYYGGIFRGGPNDSAGAFGAIGAPDGGIFIASGDLTGLTLTTSTTRYVYGANGDITLGLGGSDTGDTKITGFAGPSFKLMGQNVVTDTTVDIPERASGAAFPLYVDSRSETLNSFYFGGLAGVNLSHQVSPDLTVNAGGKVGLYAVNSTFQGSETYTVGSQTATLANGPSASDMGMAYSLAVNGGVTKKINEKMDFGVNLGADFLSRVATVTKSTASPTVSTTGYGPGSDDGTVAYNTPQTFAAPILTFGSMITWRASASLTGHF